MKSKSVKSFHPCKSLIQTIYAIVKAHGGVPIAIGMKVASEEGTEFIFSIRAEAIYI